MGLGKGSGHTPFAAPLAIKSTVHPSLLRPPVLPLTPRQDRVAMFQLSLDDDDRSAIQTNLHEGKGALNAALLCHGSSTMSSLTQSRASFPPVPPALPLPRGQDHVALFQLSLDDADRSAIQAVLDEGKRPQGDCYAWERGMGPF